MKFSLKWTCLNHSQTGDFFFVPIWTLTLTLEFSRELDSWALSATHSWFSQPSRLSSPPCALYGTIPMAILVCVCPQEVMEPLSNSALIGLPSMIKLYSRFSIYCQCCEFPLKIHFPINLWFFSRLFQFSFLTFSVESRMGIHPPERAWSTQGWLGEKGVWGCYTENSGIRTWWAGLFFCARERGIFREPVK